MIVCVVASGAVRVVAVASGAVGVGSGTRVLALLFGSGRSDIVEDSSKVRIGGVSDGKV